MFVNYLDPDPMRATWAQYDRAMAGYYRGGRRARRLREIEAHRQGLQQRPALLRWSPVDGLLLGARPSMRGDGPARGMLP